MITAIVLAAGKSSRMGSKNKMFLPFGDTTVVSHVIAELIMSRIDEIVVITDSEEHVNELAIISNVRVRINPAPEKGMTSSIQTGVLHCRENSHYLVCLGDMPLIRSNEYNILIDKFLEEKQKAIVQPTFKSLPGNPVLFPNHLRDAILKLNEPDGCKPVVIQNKNILRQVEMPSDSIRLDIDTEEDYLKLLNRVS